jgi:hypothetical protein
MRMIHLFRIFMGPPCNWYQYCSSVGTYASCPYPTPSQKGNSSIGCGETTSACQSGASSSHAALSIQNQTYIERLNRTIPNHIRPQARRRPTNNHIIINSHTFRPQRLALLGAVVSVVFKADGSWAAIVCGIGAHAACMALVALPVWRDHAVAVIVTV